MQIAILGTGRVGQTLAEGLTSAGHTITFGSRNPATKDLPDYQVTDRDKAVRGADVVISAIAGAAAADAVQEIGPDVFEGKVLLDLGNAVTEHMELVYPNASLGQRLQEILPGTKVVKSLNTLAAPLMINPSAIGPSTVFVCGNDAAAKSTVTELLRDLGWGKDAIVDLGEIAAARGTEHYFLLFVALWQAVGSPTFNIHVVAQEASE